MATNFTFKLRRGTAAQWTSSNPILLDGEPGVESDTKKFKIGDGITAWLSLPYFINEIDITALVGTGGGGGTGAQGPPGPPGAPGSQGPAGPTGSTGPPGADGADGTSVNIAGSVPNVASLPTGLTVADAGTGYLTTDNGHLHVWSGTSWTDVGNITGPTGAQGPPGATGGTGPQGATGPLGPQGIQGVAGPAGAQGTVGPTGAQGLPGASTSLFKFKARTGATSGDPTAGKIIWNNVTQTLSTSILVDILDDNGLDVSIGLASLQPGNKLYLQDYNTSANYQDWTITSVTDSSGYFTLGVTLNGSGGTGTSNFLANLALALRVTRPGPVGPAGPAGATGPTGPTGPTGAAGTVWRVGTGVPSNALGVNGDLYMNNANGDVYQRNAGAYGILTNIRGPAGVSGSLVVNDLEDVPPGSPANTPVFLKA